MCLHLDIVPIPATVPSSLSPYYAGFFDADGTIGCHLRNKIYPHVYIKVGNKYVVDILPFQTAFGGKVYPDATTNSHVWAAENKQDVLIFLNYYNTVGWFKSHKSKRFLLIEEHYESL